MRKDGEQLVPYYTRAEIENGALDGRGLEPLYLDDPVELFFMQMQGSGRVRLTDGIMGAARLCGEERPFLYLDREGCWKRGEKPPGADDGRLEGLAAGRSRTGPSADA